jgi:hypothetical protein
MQAYSNPKRASDPYALPDIEVFYISLDDTVTLPDEGFADGGEEYTDEEIAEINKGKVGFYYWHCLPGCLPDSDPIGPFETEEQALADAQSESWQYNDES